MKNLTCLMLAWFWLSLPIFPKQTELRVEDNGVLGAMQRLGCSADWLSVVLHESNILESELRRLPPETPVIAPDECTTKLPPPEDAATTQQIFEREAALENGQMARQGWREEESKEALIKLNQKFEKQRQDLMSAQERISRLESNLTKVKQEREMLLQRSLVDPARQSSNLKWFVTFALGALLTLSGALLFHSHQRATCEILPIIRKGRSAGKSFNFTLVTEPRRYECPLCHAKDIDSKHLARHLSRSHPEVRLEVVPTKLPFDGSETVRTSAPI